MLLFVRFAFIFFLLLPINSYALSFSMDNAPLQDLTSWVSKATNKKIIVPSSVNIPVSVTVSDIAIDEVWPFYSAVISSNNLHIEEENGFYFVRPGSSALVTPSVDQGEQLHDVKPPRITERSEIYQLHSVSVDRVLSALQSVVSAFDVVQPGGKVSPLPDGRSFHVYAVDQVHDQVKLLLPVLDVAVPRVLVEALVFEVSEDQQKDVGVSIRAVLDSFTAATTFATAKTLGAAAQFMRSDFSALVSALETVDSVRLLSTPRILVNAGQSGRVVAGQNVPFVTGQTVGSASDTKTPFQTIERKDVGVSLDVTPHVLSDQLVDLVIKQESSRVSNDSFASDVVTDTRQILTRVNVAPGEWICLGGLVLDQSGSSSAGVPGLRSIPVLGHLFRMDHDTSTKRSLSILLRLSFV